MSTWILTYNDAVLCVIIIALKSSQMLNLILFTHRFFLLLVSTHL